jgi:magnesium transporter
MQSNGLVNGADPLGQPSAEEPLEQLLGSAAAHAARNVPIAAPDETVNSVLDRMRGVRFDSAVVVAVCSGQQLVGLVTIERLLAAPGHATLATVMDSEPPVVRPGVDQEQAAWLAAQRAEPGLAVVDMQGRFRGLIPPQRLAVILLEEHDEDMARLGGFLRSSANARSASEESIARRLWHRLPWLAVGLIGAMLSAILLGSVEDQISANLAVAYFIPAIVYLADAVGTQTETLAIRGLCRRRDRSSGAPRGCDRPAGRLDSGRRDVADHLVALAGRCPGCDGVTGCAVRCLIYCTAWATTQPSVRSP